MVAGVVIDVTEPVDALRRPLNEIDSRFLRVLLGPLAVDELDCDTWRGTREVAVAVDGDARMDCR